MTRSKTKKPPSTLTKNVEQILQELLIKLKLNHQVSTDNINNIIYFEQNHTDFMHLAGTLLEKTTVDIDPDEVFAIIKQAWNSLPHKSLNNFSPETVESDKLQPPSPIYNSDIRYTDELFLDEKLARDMFIEVDSNRWEFILGSASIKLRRKYDELINSAASFSQFQKSVHKLVSENSIFIPGILTFGEILEENNKTKVAFQLYTKVIQAVEKLFPSTFNPENSQLPWAMLGNRPILTLYFRHAILTQEIENDEKSLPLLKRLLRLNPNDNQGVRFLLANTYLRLKQYDAFLQLKLEYENEDRAEFIMGELFLKWVDGKSKDVKEFIRTNWFRLCHSINELLKQEHYPTDENVRGTMIIGDESEAYVYWVGQGDLWDSVPDAKAYFQQVVYTKAREEFDEHWRIFELETKVPAATSGYFQNYDKFLSGNPQPHHTQNLIFRIKLDYDKRIYRDVMIPNFETLETLHLSIMTAFQFDNDHLYAFHLDYKKWGSQCVIDSYRFTGDSFGFGPDKLLKVHQVPLWAVVLEPKKKWTYIFDFGDDWWFEIEYRGCEVYEANKKYPRIIKSHGEAPAQYGNE